MRIKFVTCLILSLLMWPSFATVSVAGPPLAESVFVKSAGTELYLELRGRSDPAPILLYLHGGPGSAFGLISFRAYVGPQLESRYLVAYLHERGVANSPSVPDSTQTIAKHLVDVKNVVNYLRTRFRHRHLYVLGHSWGGSLAVLSSIRNHLAVDGIIDVAGPFNIQATLSASYAMTLRWATDSANSKAINDLKRVGPPPYSYAADQGVLSNWASTAYGGLLANLSRSKLLSREPFTSIKPEWAEVQTRLVQAMNSEFSRLNFETQLKRQRVPLLVIVGLKDAVVPASCLRVGYERYGGPKDWVELSESHHLPFVDEPEAFVKSLIPFIR